MINFEERNGQLFEMVEKPIPLTVDAQMPCLVRLIQDNSPMGRCNKETCKSVALSTTYHISEDSPLSRINGVSHCNFEIIGIPVPEGSAKWAMYQMQMGKIAVSKDNIQYRIDDNRVVWLIDGTWHDFCDLHGDAFPLPGNYLGWTIYEEPEPETIKTPIVDCKNCIKKCGKRNDSIDHCVDYEPEPEPAFKVRDWVTDGVVQGRMVTRTGDTTWIEAQDGKQYHIETSHLRKLDPAEVIVKIGCLSGTVEKAQDYAYFLLWHSKTDCDYSIIKWSALDAPTRERVETLLNAQEEK